MFRRDEPLLPRLSSLWHREHSANGSVAFITSLAAQRSESAALLGRFQPVEIPHEEQSVGSITSNSPKVPLVLTLPLLPKLLLLVTELMAVLGVLLLQLPLQAEPRYQWEQWNHSSSSAT